jgi:hypothetical protein
MTIAISGTTGITLAGQFDSASSFGFKNRIINGQMQIDQRNAGASVAFTSAAVSLDRWNGAVTSSAGTTIQRSTTSTAGFSNSALITIGTGTSPASGAVNRSYQVIEGFNIVDFAWGTASAATVTLSFWVRSSVTGTFSGALYGASTVQSYPFNYTINAANTFEQKTVTIAGPTTGTWDSTNGAGVYVNFDLGSGTTFKGTANAWATGTFIGVTGAINLCATTGATFYITGVQLEKGSVATSFDYRPFTTELQLCQRYFEKSYNTDVAVATSTDTGTVSTRSPQADMQDTIQFAVEKRSGPDIVYYTGLGVINNWRDVSAGVNKGMATAVTGSRQFTWANSGSMPVGNVLRGHWTASVEL